MVDVQVTIGLPEGSDVADAYDVRDRLIKEAEQTRLDVMPLMRGTPVAGGTQFDPLVADQTFETKNTRDAHIAVGVLAAILLKQGYTVAPVDGKLLNYNAPAADPEPGVAQISVVAPLGQP